ncbi:MAG: hypothetical protein AAFU50_08100 [Pseudomonadota bacterium]
MSIAATLLEDRPLFDWPAIGARWADRFAKLERRITSVATGVRLKTTLSKPAMQVAARAEPAGRERQWATILSLRHTLSDALRDVETGHARIAQRIALAETGFASVRRRLNPGQIGDGARSPHSYQRRSSGAFEFAPAH